MISLFQYHSVKNLKGCLCLRLVSFNCIYARIVSLFCPPVTEIYNVFLINTVFLLY